MIDILNGPPVPDERVNQTLLDLPPLPTGVLLVLRHMQRQIEDLTATVERLTQP
ncbi:MAG: hypothetical protein ACK5OX_08765 [Desertimonas sp.]